MMPNPIIDRALWHLLVNGATADMPYPRCFEQPLQRSIVRAMQQGRTDVANFAQIQLERMLLLPEEQEPTHSTEADPFETEGRSAYRRSVWFYDNAKNLICVGTACTTMPFLVNWSLASLYIEGVTPPMMFSTPFTVACVLLGLGSMIVGGYFLREGWR